MVSGRTIVPTASGLSASRPISEQPGRPERIELVDELHQADTRCSDAHGSRSCVTRRIVSWVFRRSAFGLIELKFAGRRNAIAANRLGDLIDEPPDAGEEPPLEPGIGPLDLLRRSHEPRSRRASAPYFESCRPDRQRCPSTSSPGLLEDHALCQQPRKRLVEMGQADVAKDRQKKRE